MAITVTGSRDRSGTCQAAAKNPAQVPHPGEKPRAQRLQGGRGRWVVWMGGRKPFAPPRQVTYTIQTSRDPTRIGCRGENRTRVCVNGGRRETRLRGNAPRPAKGFSLIETKFRTRAWPEASTPADRLRDGRKGFPTGPAETGRGGRSFSWDELARTKNSTSATGHGIPRTARTGRAPAATPNLDPGKNGTSSTLKTQQGRGPVRPRPRRGKRFGPAGGRHDFPPSRPEPRCRGKGEGKFAAALEKKKKKNGLFDEKKPGPGQVI